MACGPNERDSAMSLTDWRSFWNSYRRKEVASEDDLFIEVGKTVHGLPISREEFRLTIERIVMFLHLKPNDRLLELCCGNGLMTRALAPAVAEIEAVDFGAHLIAHAREQTRNANVHYVCADVWNISKRSPAPRVLFRQKFCWAMLWPISSRQVSRHTRTGFRPDEWPI